MRSGGGGVMRVGRVVGVAAVSLALLASLQPAEAWWRGGYGGGGYYGGGWRGGYGYGYGYRGGVFFGFPPIYAPPIYAPPPIYYAQPLYAPPVYAPPVYAAPSAAQGCYAGPYVCPLDTPVAIGGPCSCPANNGRVFGRAG